MNIEALLITILGLTALGCYFWGDQHRYNAECYRHHIRAHRAAAAAFVVEVAKLERRAAYLERKRLWATRRAWRKRSGYRALMAPVAMWTWTEHGKRP